MLPNMASYAFSHVNTVASNALHTRLAQQKCSGEILVYEIRYYTSLNNKYDFSSLLKLQNECLVNVLLEGEYLITKKILCFACHIKLFHSVRLSTDSLHQQRYQLQLSFSNASCGSVCVSGFLVKHIHWGIMF